MIAEHSESTIGKLKHDWLPVRRAYVTESPCPTYEELSNRFGLPVGTVSRRSSMDGWPTLRVAYQSELDKSNGVSDVVRRAALNATAIGDQAFEVASAGLEEIRNGIERVSKNSALSDAARSNIMNTYSFAYQNLANGSKAFGVLGFGTALGKAARPGDMGANGQWSPSVLAGINVTIQNMVKSGESSETPAVSVQAAEAKPASEPAAEPAE